MKQKPPTLIPKTIPKLQNSLRIWWYHGFSFKACSELQNKERETRLKRAIKGLIQGKSIWLEAYKNKIALIISKYACELGRINKNQAKAIVQAINGAKHTKWL